MYSLISVSITEFRLFAANTVTVVSSNTSPSAVLLALDALSASEEALDADVLSALELLLLEESVELEKEDVDLYELTREIVSRLSPQAAQKNIRIELSGESVHYHGIRQILDEMVYNVCENAVKYNYENGKVSVWAGNTLNGPKISVSDTGIGIPKEHQERIFERFYRVDKSHSKERGGTGLGLSIVKHGALLHGAKVSVESEEGRGTKISMQFPRICQK